MNECERARARSHSDPWSQFASLSLLRAECQRAALIGSSLAAARYPAISVFSLRQDLA